MHTGTFLVHAGCYFQNYGDSLWLLSDNFYVVLIKFCTGLITLSQFIECIIFTIKSFCVVTVIHPLLIYAIIFAGITVFKLDDRGELNFDSRLFNFTNVNLVAIAKYDEPIEWILLNFICRLIMINILIVLLAALLLISTAYLADTFKYTGYLLLKFVDDYSLLLKFVPSG